MSSKFTHYVVSALLLLLVIGSAIPVQAETSLSLDPVELGAFFDGLIAAQMAAEHIPGVTVAVVADGEIVFSKGYGYADLQKRVPVDAATTLFRPGSVSKLFTWTAVMQLVEQGKLDLDADVNTYLDFEIPATYPEPITLYHLMAHTPGFEDQGQGLFLKDPADLQPLGDYLKHNVPARVYPPGKYGAYSNYGSALAGYIVERVSGEPFATYIEDHILGPLDMTRSSFRQPLPADLAPDMAKGYGYSKGDWIQGDFEVVGAPPAGALSATSVDMAKFMIAHLQDGRYGDTRILAEATAQEMHRQHQTPDPRVSGMAHGFMERKVNGRRIIYHLGDTFLFHSGLYLLLDEKVGLFVSYNSSGVPGNTARDDLLGAFMDRYFPAPESPALERPAGFAERAGRYVGEYHMARANFSSPEKLLRLFQSLQITATPDNTLLASMAGQTKAYVEVAPDTFQNVLNAQDRVVFLSDDRGKVTGLQVEGLAPIAFVKAPFYATSRFNLLLLAGSMLLCLATLIGWPIAFVARRAKLYGDRWLPRIARFAAAGFSLVAIVSTIGFLGVFGDMDPAYGVPRILFGPTPAFVAVMNLALVLLVLGISVLVFAVLAWAGIGNDGRKAYWTLGARLHYTALAAVVAAIFWLMSYWRIWGGM
jgi:CubicO group peptidase (beta-lactamase class C family)